MDKYLAGLLFCASISVSCIVALEGPKDVVASQKGQYYRTISDLENEKNAILLSGGNAFMPAQQKRLKEIEREIYQIKTIAGDVWGIKRRVVLGSIALLGLSALAFEAYIQYDRYEKTQGRMGHVYRLERLLRFFNIRRGNRGNYEEVFSWGVVVCFCGIELYWLGSCF